MSETCYRCRKETDAAISVDLNTGPDVACRACWRARQRYFEGEWREPRDGESRDTLGNIRPIPADVPDRPDEHDGGRE